jgi:hypothetical protein
VLGFFVFFLFLKSKKSLKAWLRLLKGAWQEHLFKLKFKVKFKSAKTSVTGFGSIPNLKDFSLRAEQRLLALLKTLFR